MSSVNQHPKDPSNYSLLQKYKERETSKKPSKTLEESCKMLEEKLDLFNLLLIRQRVNIDIAKLRDSEPPQKSGWFGGWWGANAAKSDNDDGAATGLKLGKITVIHFISKI